MAACFPELEAEQYTCQVQLCSGQESQASALMKDWRERLGSGYSLEDMEEFAGQTLGQVANQVKRASGLVMVLGIALESIMVMLFLKLRLAKQAGDLAVKRAMGISYRSILMQELYPVMLAGGCGILFGLFLTEALGDVLVSAIFALLNVGLKRIAFASLPFGETIGLLAVLFMVPVLVTAAVCRSIRKLDVVRAINE